MLQLNLFILSSNPQIYVTLYRVFTRQTFVYGINILRNDVILSCTKLLEI